MDHAEACELLELAAIEPDGFDRLVAGDTPEAAALAGHLAGCAACAEEFERLRRAAVLIRASLGEEAVATAPADLRARTLSYVSELGRERGREAAAAAPSALERAGGGVGSAASVVDVAPAPIPAPIPAAVAARSRARSVRWWVSLAAALVIGAGIGGLAVGATERATIEDQQATVSALARVNSWTLRVAQRPDATTVTLTSPTGGPASGTLVFAPTTGELVVVMNGVAPPPAGREYRCWVETNGTRRSVGKMFFGGDLGYWAGRVDGLTGLAPGAVFGVSLVDPADSSLGGEPILRGSL